MEPTMRRGDRRRGDTAVWSISAVLAVIAVAGVAFSLLVLDRRPATPAPSPGDSDASLLVVTWAPSLCKVERANPGCRSGNVQRMGQAFVLHGLWPQPATEQYCDVPRGGKRPSLALPKDVQSRLQATMSDATVMAPHEWYAHGTCSGLAPPEYFGIAATFTDQARTVLEPAFRESVGRRLAPGTVRDAFDARFGSGVGDRVGLSCREVAGQGSIVYEVRLSLPAVASLRGDSLGQALAEGPVIPPGCGKGRVP